MSNPESADPKRAERLAGNATRRVMAEINAVGLPYATVAEVPGLTAFEPIARALLEERRRSFQAGFDAAIRALNIRGANLLHPQYQRAREGAYLHYLNSEGWE